MTYEVTIVVGNLQEHQLEALELLVGKLEINGVKCHTFDIQTFDIQNDQEDL